ncbi:MAG: HAD family phosphatase [Candidatus Omnitrophota bacterium]|nr:HAD family phosphatase [Candidatus Omnitrophota bacterium]
MTRTNGNIKAIIFDLGNVLVDFDHRVAANRIAQYCNKSARDIYDLFFDSETTRLFEEGKISEEDFFLKVKSALDLDLDFSGFVPIWNEIFFLSIKNRAVYALAEKLKKRYRTAVLSNINSLHYEYIKKTFPVFGAFHEVFTSCQLGFIKPDHRIYAGALSALGVRACEAFYTDDRLELIESAAKLGIRCATFSGFVQLETDLAGAGININ